MATLIAFLGSLILLIGIIFKLVFVELLGRLIKIPIGLLRWIVKVLKKN